MNWQSWQDFLAMGGYAAYVWPAFGISLGWMLLEIISLRLRLRHAQSRLQTQIAKAHYENQA